MFTRVTHIADHRLLRLLGEGSSAEVYEVLTPDGDRRALKLLKGDLAPAFVSKLQARLGQEGEAIAMIEHVNVLRFHDAGLEQGRVWLLLELVDGPDLRTLAERNGGTLPLVRALRLVRQAGEGVAAAHALGILHRDLRPENLLIADGDVVKVADFGSAKLEGWGVKTTAEQAIGSSLYRAPESLHRGGARPESDVYALGLVLYELLTGAHPIAALAATPIQICRLQMTYAPPPLGSLGRDFPGDLSELVQQALSKDPACRPTMRAFTDALAVVLRRLQAPQRAVARGLALPNRELALARTEQAMPAVGPHGTMPMPAFPALPAIAADADQRSALDPGRSALLPPAPSGAIAPRSLPGGAATLRSAVAPAGARISDGERASTHVPVERAQSRARFGRSGAPSMPTSLVFACLNVTHAAV